LYTRKTGHVFLLSWRTLLGFILITGIAVGAI